MKIFSISLTLILLISCAKNFPPKDTDSSIPVVEISPISNATAENKPSVPDKIVATVPIKLPASPIPEKVNTKDFLKKECPNCLKELGLYDLEKHQLDLEKHQLRKDNLEIRVWQISGLFMPLYKDLAVKESVFILNRTNGSWSAKVFRNIEKDKSRVEKLIKTKLSEPKEGWENLWQKLLDNELLTFPDSISGKVESAADANIFITESRIGEIFKAYEYAGNQQMRELRHSARILNIIAEDFDLKDFQATKKYE